MNNKSPGNGNGSKAGSWEPVHRLSEEKTGMNDGTDAVSREVMERVWSERAAQFAELPQVEDAGVRVDLLVVRLGREFYGFEAQYVFRIRPATQITSVPRMPSWMAGIVNERGRILSVLDVQDFLRLPSVKTEGGNTRTSLIIVETPELELALLVDEVLEIQTVRASRVQKASDTTRSIPTDYVHGVIVDLESLRREGADVATLVVLDLRALLADEKLIVYEEIV